MALSVLSLTTGVTLSVAELDFIKSRNSKVNSSIIIIWINFEGLEVLKYKLIKFTIIL